jgi:protein-disulfide isomerase
VRSSCVVVAVAALLLMLTGCSREIAGVAKPHPRQPGVALSSDGYGIVAGFADAPVQLEIFTEPQCEHCAHLQATSGDEIKRNIESGRLAVTYRPLTFFDAEPYIVYSALVSNALFLTVDPATSAGTFQSFVEDLWAHQDLAGQDVSNDDIADLAKESGVSDYLVDRIRSGKSVIDTDEMDSANSDTLAGIADGNVGTPTVYDLKQKDIVDISDDGWLDKLLRTT